MSGVLTERRKDGVVVLTLNDPKRRNPMSDRALLDPLVAALREVETDPEARVLLITGAGPCFSAGGNLKDMQAESGMFAGRGEQIAEAYRATVQQIPLILSRIDIPTIAAVNGPAYGAGCDLSLMCDMRLASTTARFGEVFVDLGLVSGDGGGWFLVRHLGYQRAAEISFRARPVAAEEALELGLVLSLHAPEDLMAATLAMASEMAAKPAPAQRMTKRLLRMAERTHLQDYLAAVAAMQALAHGTDEHADRVATALKPREG
ncbi:enoyl-CoA hydratase [Aquicoccus sp. SCR17]|nr:enoyl-CoA hydratase [Carideicomes alvinocaridis]